MRDVRAEKRRLRREVIALRRAMPEEIRAAKSAAITARVLASDAWAAAETLFCYIGTGWELDTRPLIRAALAAGKRVAVPLCGAAGEMTAHCITSCSDLTPGAFGIPEPYPDAPLLLPEDTDLAIIPAVCFDREGDRLGRGGGYYDRYLPRVRGLRMGLVFQDFILDAVPREAHDCRVQSIITEEGEILWA